VPENGGTLKDKRLKIRCLYFVIQNPHVAYSILAIPHAAIIVITNFSERRRVLIKNLTQRLNNAAVII
jgi:hypothetical protein